MLQRRPAIVVSAGELAGSVPLVWVAMVTSLENRPWPGDISLAAAHGRFGLPQPCVIRPAKIATIEARGAERIGALDEPTVQALLQAILSIVRRPATA